MSKALNLIIAVTLVAALGSSSNILGFSYAQSKSGVPNIGSSEESEVDPDLESENGQMVSPQANSQNRFCLEGSGGFGRTCIPCDPAKVTPGMNTKCSIFQGSSVMSTQEDEQITFKPLPKTTKSLIQKDNALLKESSSDLVDKLHALDTSLQNFEKATEADSNMDDTGIPDTARSEEYTPREQTWGEILADFNFLVQSILDYIEETEEEQKK